MKVLAERFLHKLFPYFDFVFAQLGFIPITRTKFVEIVAVAERYSSKKYGIKEAAVLNILSRKIN